jgi:hypothetical protein
VREQHLVERHHNLESGFAPSVKRENVQICHLGLCKILVVRQDELAEGVVIQKTVPIRDSCENHIIEIAIRGYTQSPKHREQRDLLAIPRDLNHC